MRVKRSVPAHQRHKKLLKQAKGYKYGRSKLFKEAKQAVMKAGQNAYVGRKMKKRTFRALWIARLNAALRAQGIMYSRFIDALSKKNIALDRKVLSNLAIEEPAVFKKIVEEARAGEPALKVIIEHEKEKKSKKLKKLSSLADLA